MGILTDLCDFVTVTVKTVALFTAEVLVLAFAAAMAWPAWDWPDKTRWPAVAGVWLVCHLASCKRRPGKACWRSRCPLRRGRDQDEHGHFQYRRDCWVCGSGVRHRLGAAAVGAKVRGT